MSMPAALQRRRDYAGPAVFSYGFRPFFLAAGLWASIGILLWLPQYMGYCTLPTYFGPLEWHVHEMLFGFAAATIAGFLLTAIPNWTGRLPVNGTSLAALVALWLAGRSAILFSAWIGGAVAAAIDTSFLFILALVAAREIVAGKNWRNLRVFILLTLLIASNVTFHVEFLTTGSADYSIRLAIAAVILLISLIGGRIVPSFTGSWLARENPGRLPVSFGRYDMATMLASAVALVGWIASPVHVLTGALLLTAGILQSVPTHAMGGRARHARTPRVSSARRLPLPAAWLSAPRNVDLCTRRGHERRHSRLDGRRYRSDDCRGHDARIAWTHRQCTTCENCDGSRVRDRLRRGHLTHCSGADRIAAFAGRIGPALDRRLRPLRLRVWPDAAQAEARQGDRRLLMWARRIGRSRRRLGDLLAWSQHTQTQSQRLCAGELAMSATRQTRP
jgi:hypothetical protein